jgi:hypothetical protein
MASNEDAGRRLGGQRLMIDAAALEAGFMKFLVG